MDSGAVNMFFCKALSTERAGRDRHSPGRGQHFNWTVQRFQGADSIFQVPGLSWAARDQGLL